MSYNLNTATAVGTFIEARPFKKNADGTPKLNSDGSLSLAITIGIRHNWTAEDGNVGMDFVDFEAFIPAGRRNPFEHTVRGETVGFQYRPRKSVWMGEDGQTQSRQFLQVNIMTVDYLTSKADRDRLIARNAQKEAVAAAQSGSDTAEETSHQPELPFEEA